MISPKSSEKIMYNIILYAFFSLLDQLLIPLWFFLIFFLIFLNDSSFFGDTFFFFFKLDRSFQAILGLLFFWSTIWHTIFCGLVPLFWTSFKLFSMIRKNLSYFFSNFLEAGMEKLFILFIYFFPKLHHRNRNRKGKFTTKEWQEIAWKRRWNGKEEEEEAGSEGVVYARRTWGTLFLRN